jgi:hypothetical protein
MNNESMGKCVKGFRWRWDIAECRRRSSRNRNIFPIWGNAGKARAAPDTVQLHSGTFDHPADWHRELEQLRTSTGEITSVRGSGVGSR